MKNPVAKNLKINRPAVHKDRTKHDRRTERQMLEDELTEIAQMGGAYDSDRCPHCGHAVFGSGSKEEIQWVYGEDIETREETYGVVCDRCEAHGPMEPSMDKAISSYLRRISND